MLGCQGGTVRPGKQTWAETKGDGKHWKIMENMGNDEKTSEKLVQASSFSLAKTVPIGPPGVCSACSVAPSHRMKMQAFPK